MPEYRPFAPKVQAAFEAGQLTWESSVRDLKYFGQYLETRLNNLNIYNIADLVQYLLTQINQNANDDIIVNAFQAIAPLVFNAFAQQCKGDYLSRPLNRMGFNIIADVLQYARLYADWPDANLNATLQALPINIGGVLICNFNERLQPNALGPNGEMPATYCNKIAMYGNVGSDMASLRSCPCTLNPDACQGDCMWVPGMPGEPGACISRVAVYDRGNHVLDQEPYPGDWYPDDQYPPTIRNNARYVPVPPAPGRFGYMFALPVQQDMDELDGPIPVMPRSQRSTRPRYMLPRSGSSPLALGAPSTLLALEGPPSRALQGPQLPLVPKRYTPRRRALPRPLF